VTAEQLSPLLDPPPLPWHAGADDARARLAGADAALAEVRRVARLPQLLPQWSSRLARAAVVYLGLTLPNILLVVLLSVAGVRGNTPVLVWFVVIWPLVTAVGGAWLIGRVEAPRLPPTEPLGRVAPAWMAARSAGPERRLRAEHRNDAPHRAHVDPGRGGTMGTIDEARAVAAGFHQQSEQGMQLLANAGQTVAQAQVAFLGRLGRTSHVKVIEVEARCQVARQKIAEAIQALDAARQAADQFRASLS
jgi:hypothetical protein